MPARTPANGAGRPSVGCRLCTWLCDLFCSDHREGSASFWKAASDWERAQSGEWELWSATPDHARALAQTAAELYKTDPAAALDLFREAADAGSVWSMERVAWYYDQGIAGVVDFAQAQDYYRRALDAGSWTATLSYAKLLERHGYHDHWPDYLEQGVRADFVAAYFWLAWFRCKHSRKRKTFREARPLLEYAASKGHPAARHTLAVWMMFGRFGLRHIPAGFRLLRKSAEHYRAEQAGKGAPEAVPEPEPDEKLAA